MVLITAHRGCRAYEPENTIKSFERAIDFKVDIIELDVQLTKDNHLVVMHDETVDRTTNGKGCVKDLTYEQIRKLNAGKTEHVPTLKKS